MFHCAMAEQATWDPEALTQPYFDPAQEETNSRPVLTLSPFVVVLFLGYVSVCGLLSSVVAEATAGSGGALALWALSADGAVSRSWPCAFSPCEIRHKA